MIYLDNAATTWPKPEMVYQAVEDCLRGCSGNAGRGEHGDARQAAYILQETREELAELFAIKNPLQIVFTLNATDAINMSLFGKIKKGDRVITTAMEHNAVARPLRQLAAQGVQVEVIPCDHEGLLDISVLEKQLQQHTAALVMGHASNVTGRIMPLQEIGQLAKQAGACFIVDAAQTAGVEDIDVEACNIDLLAFSGHKGLLGPQGTGGLYVREGVSIKPFRYGGTGSVSELDEQPDFMPDRLESGTLNTPGIAGLLAGVRFIKKVGTAEIREKERQLAQQLQEGLQTIPGLTLYTPAQAEKGLGIVSFAAQGIDSRMLAYRLDTKAGIACRAGLHCAPWAHKCLGTLESGLVRFSTGYFNTSEQMAAVIAAVKRIMQEDL